MSQRGTKALLRLNVVAGHVGTVPSSAGRQIVAIGDMQYAVRPANQPALVPACYAEAFRQNRDALQAWQWMLRKDALGQDCFLIGPPGPRRRRIALGWCEVLGREVEYLALSRDTTEADLKQRREIIDGTLLWVDQPPVRAARAGRVLVLDGLEKAERNVLPTLNNLLENREMSLQDGTFLTAPERYDALQSSGEVEAAKLVRVHEEFRVIALGLPVPTFPGFPLDPPLRSRFQARHIGALPLGAAISILEATYPNVPRDILESLAAFSDAIARMVQSGTDMPGPRPWLLPEGTLSATCAILEKFPLEHAGCLLHRAYPYRLLPQEAAKACHDALVGLGLQEGGLQVRPPPCPYAIESVGENDIFFVGASDGAAVVSKTVHLPLTTGGQRPQLSTPAPLVDTPTHTAILTEAMQAAAIQQNICFIGPSGEGKSALARRLAAMLGYPPTSIHTLHLYKDMTSRDLFQRRTTTPSGDTKWDASPLLTAILSGGVAILDGLQRLRPDTIASLQSLCSDRDLELPDGTRLCRHDRFSIAAATVAQKEGADVSTSELLTLGEGRSMWPVHPRFRLVALAQPPGSKPTEQWLSVELLPLFTWLSVPRLSPDERVAVLTARCPSPQLPSVLQLASRLHSAVPQGSTDPAQAGWTLSLRQLIRLGRRAGQYPASLASDVRRVALASFMPVATRTSFEGIVREEIGDAPADTSEQIGITAKVEGGFLHIGDTRMRVGVNADPRLIPQTKFFDIPRHLLRLREMMRDLDIGESHLLLIGNQGTGKNKLVDHLLQLLLWEREYIQLHRDTTVSALTVQATLEQGKVVWEDSPLVQAVRYGRTLVIDEADKAPLEVVCILKGLVEDGEMTLADGRRILRDAGDAADGDRVIPIHPDFKMFLLANRPGFPFQGNDLFRETGDVYAPHVIENPDLDSEVTLLRNYAPDVDTSALRRLSSAFTELRQQVDDGLLAYPYSTRELVNISRHLQRFPGASVGEALRDILDFDKHDAHALSTLREVLLRWGIPLDAAAGGVDGSIDVEIASERRLPDPIVVERWLLRRENRVPNVSHLELEVRNCTYLLDVKRQVKLDGVLGGRASRFTEETQRFRLPLGTSRFDKERATGAVTLPVTGRLCVLAERTQTGAVSVFVADLEKLSAKTTCDHYEASFGLRSPMRRDIPINLFALDSERFGLAGERRMYIVTIGDKPLVHEITLPMDLFAADPSEKDDKSKPVPHWNTSFAAAGVAVMWLHGKDKIVVIDVINNKGRSFQIPGLLASNVWVLSPKELLVVGIDGDFLHLDISFRGIDAQLSGVLVDVVGERSRLAPQKLVGVQNGSLPSGTCACLTASDAFCGVLNRETRGAYTRRPQIEHYSKDAFAATVWPRPAPGSQPLDFATLPDGTMVCALRPDGAGEEVWKVEVIDMVKRTSRTLEPSRLGPPQPGDGEAPVGQAPFAALQVHGTVGALVQADGLVRLVELGAAELQEQRRQWELMVGTKVDGSLELRVLGEDDEDGEAEDAEADAEDSEDVEEDFETLRVATKELNKAWQGLKSASLAGSREAAISADIGLSQDGAAAATESLQNEIRAHVAATAIANSGHAARMQMLEEELYKQLEPGVQKLLEKSLAGAAALQAEAEAAMAQKELLKQDQVSSRSTSSRLPQDMSEAVARSSVAQALAGAFAGQSIESRIRQLAEEAARDFAQSTGASLSDAAAAAAQARLEAAQSLADAARNAAASSTAGQPQGADGGMQAGQGSLGGDEGIADGDAEANFDALTQQIINMADAEQMLANVLQQMMQTSSNGSSGMQGQMTGDGTQGSMQGGMSSGTPGNSSRGMPGGRQGSARGSTGGSMSASGSPGMPGFNTGQGDGTSERGQMQQAAAALMQAARGAAAGAGQGQGKGRGRGKGSGRGKGRGRGSGGRGSGTRGSGGKRSGKGQGRGPQLKSNQRGGYSDAQLAGDLSEEENAVVTQVRKRAQEVADKHAIKQSLDHVGTEEYAGSVEVVSRQIRELRVVLEQQEAKDREREWVAHQATGELDDQRLVDGVTGEKLIYRRRIEPDMPVGYQQKKPKRLSFVMDVSASMYRFNGEDGRLDRMTQAVAMVMESLDGFDHKYHWNLVGHSGNGPEINFVDFGQPPRTRQQRAQVVGQMTSASAIASSGDSTVEAIEAAVKRVASQDADDYLVFIISDANLGGYGITPEMLRRSLTADPKVTACAIFIAEREAAEMLSTALPSGRGYVCMDVSKLPNILKEIFARAATST